MLSIMLLLRSIAGTGDVRVHHPNASSERRSDTTPRNNSALPRAAKSKGHGPNTLNV